MLVQPVSFIRSSGEGVEGMNELGDGFCLTGLIPTISDPILLTALSFSRGSTVHYRFLPPLL